MINLYLKAETYFLVSALSSLNYMKVLFSLVVQQN